jgi:K+-sensing histidine kinase KdpD
MKTGYAPAERESLEKIIASYNFIKAAEFISSMLNSLPYLSAVLNKKRQVVFANEQLVEILYQSHKDFILGNRPGELLDCINSRKMIGGCGTSKYCSVCGAVNSILEAQKSNRASTMECQITAKKEETLVAYDFKVTTTPIKWENETYYLFSLIDISHEKRRRNLEKIFFHDIMNKTSSLNGFIELMRNETSMEKIKEFIEYIDLINQDLTDEIRSQRELSFAESGDLTLETELMNSIEVLNAAIQQLQHQDCATQKSIIFDAKSHSFDFMCDNTILKRILINMLKNALEASQINSEINIGCYKDDKTITFWVHNSAYINKQEQLKIFQRSFSTKGPNRGLGTYSMKLLGENYLKGKVGFESKKKSGTKFYIDLPIKKIGF